MAENKGGRPKKQIDQKEFEKLCFLQCTKQEFCSWFDTTDKTLERWCKETYGIGFSEVFRIKRENGIISLRRTQFQLAEKSPAMAIFLGKNHLGQTDKMEQTVNDISEHKGITIHFSDKKAESDGHNIPDGV
jgi:hypothetical protein